VGESEYGKGMGSNIVFSIFFIMFLNSPHRETPKNVIKKIEQKAKIGFGFFVEFFVKFFRHDVFFKTFFQKAFLVLLNSHR
jgi:hypothetical protein